MLRYLDEPTSIGFMRDRKQRLEALRSHGGLRGTFLPAGKAVSFPVSLSPVFDIFLLSGLFSFNKHMEEYGHFIPGAM